jgi:RNA polymerase sigma factor (sigma-70 family)
MIRATPRLVERACAGEAPAVEELLVSCRPDLQRFARRTCDNAQDAEDAVQVALWRLHRNIGTLRTVAAFATWLFRIVERECFRLFRGRMPTEALDDDAPGHAAPAAMLDLRMDLGRAIAELPEAYRVVLILRDIDELTAPEVAAHLGLSVEAVKSRLHRARAMLRARLVATGYRDA